ncbi:MAG: hypothetical protein Q8P40_04290 [Nitrospirota bacterium]|nr:hypothetical protein [Nitrospirota bacterium]
MAKRTESIKKKEHIVYRDPGCAIEGDKILFQCRKQPDIDKARGSDAHHYFSGYLAMNAYAVIERTFRTIRS